MAFIPDYTQWVRERLDYVPKEVSRFCGDLAGLKILNVGCGDMLADCGMLPLGVRHITGMDVHERDWDVIDHAANEIQRLGFEVAADYRERLSYLVYDGVHFPFADCSFDLIICWGAFEHIGNVPGVLAEMRRVLKKNGGRLFAAVYPWYHANAGSHLTDFIDEPFFHLNRPDEWVYAKLEEFLAENPEMANRHLEFFGPGGCSMRRLLLEVMWREYRSLNGYSARMFLNDSIAAGFVIEQLQNHFEQPYSGAEPNGVDPVDLYTSGTTVLFRPAPGAVSPHAKSGAFVIPGKSLFETRLECQFVRQELAVAQEALRAEVRNREDLQNSFSWKLTAPGRAIVNAWKRLVLPRYS